MGCVILGAIIVGVIALMVSMLKPKAVAKPLGEEQARRILGVSAQAGEEDIREAWKRLIQRNHPDSGGSHFLATQINEAKERLIGK